MDSEIRQMASVDDFMNDFKKGTFGLMIIACTEASFRSVRNTFIGRNVRKLVFYKNAMCGCSYQAALKYMAKQQTSLRGAMLEAVNNAIDEKFNGKLPWGQWVIPNVLLEHTNKNTNEYNTYLRIYSLFERTVTKSCYFDDKGLILPNTPDYDSLVAQLKPKSQSKKQSEFGFDTVCTPYAYKTKNILYIRQGNKLYTNYLRLKPDVIKVINDFAALYED